MHSRVSPSSAIAPLTNIPQDLIRHGKNHQTAKQHHHVSQVPPQPQQQQPATVQPVSKYHHDSTFPPYAKEAELIVQEEREAKSKLPLHAGLERFKLIDKMGESVYELHLFVGHSDPPLAARFPTSTKRSTSNLARESLVCSF